MANIYCPICQRTHEVKCKYKMETDLYKGVQIKHKVMYYECENVPKGDGVFFTLDMCLKNDKFFQKAVIEKGLFFKGVVKKCN